MKDILPLFFNDTDNEFEISICLNGRFYTSGIERRQKRDIYVPRNFSPQTTAICFVFYPTTSTKKQSTFNPLLPSAID